MGKFSEALHPRGHGGKFAKKGSGGGDASRAYTRKERNARAKNVKTGLRAMGASRGTARAYSKLSKDEDKGKKIVAGDGRVYSVHRSDRRTVAKFNRQADLVRKKSPAARKEVAFRKPAPAKKKAATAKKKSAKK